ncbi:hypothetical protein AMS70_19995 [Acinetobacter sp. JS678]|nr:hypothetical protein AMS70_19995 [Acinetobacter sp. JS678]
MCDKVAVSREHAPPKCFFPKEVKYRSNKLITVPSCEDHNEVLSNADQILLSILMSLPIEGNEPFKILNEQFLNNESSNFQRKINTLANQVKKVEPATLIDITNGQAYNSSIMHLEESSSIINHCLEKLGCALYFYEFQEKLKGPFFVHLDIFVNSEIRNKSINNVFSMNSILFDSLSIDYKGDVPEVFKYRIYKRPDQKNGTIIEFLFYEMIRGYFKT